MLRLGYQRRHARGRADRSGKCHGTSRRTADRAWRRANRSHDGVWGRHLFKMRPTERCEMAGTMPRLIASAARIPAGSNGWWPTRCRTDPRSRNLCI